MNEKTDILSLFLNKALRNIYRKYNQSKIYE